MQNNAFQPLGPTYLVNAMSPTQVLANTNVLSTSYRVRNVVATAAYIQWAPGTPNGQSPVLNPAAPTFGNPSPNTIALGASEIKTFILPANAWFQASAGTFEVTPGEG